MRPIIRGSIPKNEDGADYIPERYQAYRGYLIERIGTFCSYCERSMSHSIAVEHIQPKSVHEQLETTWSNLLLCCTNCNSIKNSKDVVITEYFWPDIDNTSRAFIYSSAGSIRPNTNLTDDLFTKSLNTIALTGLDREPSEDLRKNPEVTDRRWSERRNAWERANRAKQRLRQNDTSFMREQIIDTA
ncbi:MAG: HNH endonuclease, partial [Lysinibacillus sp.]